MPSLQCAAQLVRVAPVMRHAAALMRVALRPRLGVLARFAGCAHLAAALCTQAYATDDASWPQKPIKIIVAFSPGGIADISARLVANRLAERLRGSVVIENRAGAGGVIGAELVSRAPADGYTLLATSISHTINPWMYRSLSYDTRRDFAAIAMIADAPNVLAVHSGLALTSVREYIEFARAHPHALTYASSGIGTSTHLSGALFASMAGIDLVHVPYRSGGPAVAELLSGQVQSAFSPTTTILAHARAGRVRVLAVTTANRYAGEPDLPTIAESGLPGYEVSAWSGLFAPAHTPRIIIERLASDLSAILMEPAVRDNLLAQGAQPARRVTGEFDAFVASELEKWRAVVVANKMNAE